MGFFHRELYWRMVGIVKQLLGTSCQVTDYQLMTQLLQSLEVWLDVRIWYAGRIKIS